MRRRQQQHSPKMMSEADYTSVPRDEEYGGQFFVKRKKGVCPRSYNFRRNMTIASVVGLVLVAGAFVWHKQSGAGSFLGGDADMALSQMAKAGRRLAIATWNVAAINNNPFEYWITIGDNPKYEELMVNVEKFLDNPGDEDRPVHEVFTDDMFSKLDNKLTGVGWKSMEGYWKDDFRNRKIVSGFMKDKQLGLKRLASMPDRVTNTVNVAGSDEPVCRPTVINMYDGDLGTMAKWWDAWENFMFENPLKIRTPDGVQKMVPYEMLKPIKKLKYPEITEQEEKDSLPLQTMCGAIFDAILVHMMNTVSEPDEWQELKKTMVNELNKQKVPHTMDILENVYIDSDIITLQEVSSAFIDKARKSKLGKKFHIIAPKEMDSTRDQNSVVCLNKKTFPSGKKEEITSKVTAAFPEGAGVPVAPGDILAITTKNADGLPFVVASFHGDTNGLATKPVVNAVVAAMSDEKNKLGGHRLIFGLDANTYENAIPTKQQDVLDFGKSYVDHGLTSCWGDVPDPKNYTTYNARTFLQPQLNKACKSTEKREKGDVNPKDFILFNQNDFKVLQTWKDNTGEKKYIEDMAFPTLQFPSDHGILATIIQPQNRKSVN